MVGSGLPCARCPEGHWDRRDGLPSRKSAHPPSSTSEADRLTRVQGGRGFIAPVAYTRWSEVWAVQLPERNVLGAILRVHEFARGSAAATGSGGLSSSTACCSAYLILTRWILLLVVVTVVPGSAVLLGFPEHRRSLRGWDHELIWRQPRAVISPRRWFITRPVRVRGGAMKPHTHRDL